MTDWKERLTVYPESTILNALKRIDQGGIKMVLVVNEGLQLIGTLTDGDVRRALLKNVSLESPVSMAMNSNPSVALLGESSESILSRMKSKDLYQMPVVDDSKRVVRVETLQSLLHEHEIDNWVVFMAGGQGKRLHPLTSDCPKPLLKVGGKAILEQSFENFVKQGFKNFFISVNYKAEMIVDHFGDGSKWGVKIEYLRENRPLGTGGALSLLPQKTSLPMIVMNGDLITNMNFKQLLDFHNDQRADATMSVRQYEFTVPYGVVKLDEKNHMLGIDEKPVHQFFVNAGIYVLNPDMLALIPQETYYDIPLLFDQGAKSKRRILTFPIRESLMDVGQMEDFRRANEEFGRGSAF
jgi:dTDP-glucose pyrophosphorylase